MILLRITTLYLTMTIGEKVPFVTLLRIIALYLTMTIRGKVSLLSNIFFFLHIVSRRKKKIRMAEIVIHYPIKIICV